MMHELLNAIHTSNHAKLLELIQKQDIDGPLWHGFNALLLAVYFNKLESLQILLEHGADINYLVSFDSCEPTDLDTSEDMMITDYISEELIDSMQNLGNVSALHIAIKQNNYAIATLLLEHNARIDLTDQGGCTALHWAVAQNNEVLVALLMRHNADPNSLDLAGSTPLDEAKRRGLSDMVQLLSSKMN
jgi:ankyrin repeat protein